jgi:hypothetical protein
MYPNYHITHVLTDNPIKGGRLVTEPEVLSELFVCDLQTFKWERIRFASTDYVPPARSFHSADACKSSPFHLLIYDDIPSSLFSLGNDQLVIFGGIGAYELPPRAEGPCLLNDVQIFDLDSNRWLSTSVLNDSGLAGSVPAPKPRHSHLSSVTANRLLIIGGGDSDNLQINDIYVYDLENKTWVQQLPYDRYCVTFSSVAACADERVRLPSAEHRSVSFLSFRL